MTAALLDSGDGVTHCIPISEGYIQQAFIERINLAGRHVTQYLTKLLLLRQALTPWTAIDNIFCYLEDTLSTAAQISSWSEKSKKNSAL